MSEITNRELANWKRADSYLLWSYHWVDTVSFEEAVENIAAVYNAIMEAATRQGNSRLAYVVDMKTWHHPCGTKHCLAGWSHELFDRGNNISAKTSGMMRIWPLCHLFHDTTLTQSQLIKHMEEFLESVGYEIIVNA